MGGAAEGIRPVVVTGGHTYYATYYGGSRLIPLVSRVMNVPDEVFPCGSPLVPGRELRSAKNRYSRGEKQNVRNKILTRRMSREACWAPPPLSRKLVPLPNR